MMDYLQQKSKYCMSKKSCPFLVRLDRKKSQDIFYGKVYKKRSVSPKNKRRNPAKISGVSPGGVPRIQLFMCVIVYEFIRYACTRYFVMYDPGAAKLGIYRKSSRNTLY